jgi:pectate lyase
MSTPRTHRRIATLTAAALVALLVPAGSATAAPTATAGDVAALPSATVSTDGPSWLTPGKDGRDRWDRGGRHGKGGWPGRGRGRDLGTEVLAPGDGWASAGSGTTGGKGAAPENVVHVETWPELRAALGGDAARGDTTPRIVYVHGTIHAGDTADGARLTCADYEAASGFSMDEYIATYDPAVWGWDTDPSGPLEDARVAAAAVQAAQTQQHVGSNVTLVGMDDARIVGANLRIRDSQNVILRNLTVSDAYDCFPEWDPSDTNAGNWNSAYDNVSVWSSTNVWVDHMTFDDGDTPHESLPVVYGRPYEVHDGLLDITHGSDLVTVSYNRFESHDKTMLIGSSDSRTDDRGTLRVTLHHNLWTDIGQRAPRVRYGQVHVYNNHYEQTREGLFQYYWGVGVESAIYAEANSFDLARGVTADRIIAGWKGTQITVKDSLVNGRRADVLAAYNAANEVDLSGDVGWTPEHATRVDPVRTVERTVRREAGAGRIDCR